jgi:hypothetical protein
MPSALYDRLIVDVKNVVSAGQPGMAELAEELCSNAVWKYNIICAGLRRDRNRLAKKSKQSDTLHLATMSHLTACSSSNILLSSSSEPERVGARC